jgi:hypothetical protein
MKKIICICGEFVYLEVLSTKQCLTCGTTVSTDEKGNAFADSSILVRHPLESVDDGEQASFDSEVLLVQQGIRETAINLIADSISSLYSLETARNFYLGNEPMSIEEWVHDSRFDDVLGIYAKDEIELQEVRTKCIEAHKNKIVELRDKVQQKISEES